MTVLPTERPRLAPAPVVSEIESHPRLDRRRRRRRQRIESALVILVLPLAVALTLFTLLTASGGSVLPAQQASARPVVRVLGTLPTTAVAGLAADGVDLDVVAAAPTARDRTEILYFSAEDRELAEDLRATIGRGVVVLGATQPDGARIVVRVGEDMAE